MDSPLWVIMAPTGHQGGGDDQHRSYLLIPCPEDRVEQAKAGKPGENKVILLDLKSLRPVRGHMLGDGVATRAAANIAARPEKTNRAAAARGAVPRIAGGAPVDRKRPPPKRAEVDHHHRGRRLTTRQTEILMALKDGASNKEIARCLGILESTVKVHLKTIYRQLHVKNRTQAAIVSAQYEPVRS